MRWVFITLVFLNAGFAGWHFYGSSLKQAKPVEITKSQLLAQTARPLQLLSELTKDDLLRLEQLKAERIKMQAPEPQSAPELESDPESVVRASAETEEIRRPEPVMCTILGPFPALSDAEIMLKRIQSLDLFVKVQEIEIEEGPGYWVYMGPMANQKEALEKLKEVRRQKIDSYVVTRGQLANSVSFGVFSRKELAESRLKQMRKAGLKAKIHEFVRSRKENWLLLPPGEVDKMAQNTWQELLSEDSELQMRQNYCPGVAKS